MKNHDKMNATKKQTGIAKFFRRAGKDASSNVGATPQSTGNNNNDPTHPSSQRRLTGLKRSAWELETVRLLPILVLEQHTT